MNLSGWVARLSGSWRKILVMIAALAVVLRIVVELAAPPIVEHDAIGYDRLARRLLAGEGFVYYQWPSAERTPGYPLFLAAIYGLGGSPPAVGIVQAVLDGGTILLMGALGVLLGVAPIGILAAAMLAAVFPPLLQQPAGLYSETLFQFFLMLAFVLSLEVTSLKRGVLAGIAWGLAVLIRPAPVYWIPILAVMVAARAKWRNRAAGIALLVAFVVTISPWIIRNMRAVGAPVLSTLGYQDLYVYNAALDLEDWLLVPESFGQPLRELGKRIGWGANMQITHRDVQIDSLCRAEAFQLIGEYPGRFALLSLVKVARLWGNVGYGRAPSWQSVAVAIFMGGLLLIFFIQFFRRRAWQEFAILASVIFLIYNTALHSVSIAFFRHNVPVLPLFFLLVAWGIWREEGGKAEMRNLK